MTAPSRARVAGYLLKAEAPERLIESIRCAARGEYLIDGGQLARVQRWETTVLARWENLTAREREVLIQLQMRVLSCKMVRH